MSAARPKRARKAPERFGSLVDPTKEEVEALLASDSSDGEAAAAPAAKRRKRAAAVRSDDESSEGEAPAGGSDSEGGGGSGEEGEEEEEAPRAGAKRRRGAGAAKPPAPYVPAPPREPRSRGDMMSLLFACPALIGARAVVGVAERLYSLLEPDGLRTVTLVARDAAQLAAALGARAADMAGIWEQLARRCQPDFAGGADEALAVVRQAVRADPARAQQLNTKAAESQFRVTRSELKGLPHSTRYSESFWADTIKMYSKLDVLAIAHRKWGNVQMLEYQLRLAAGRTQAARDRRESAADRRSTEMGKLLAKAGLEGPTSRRHSYAGRRLIKAYIKKNEGTPAAIIAALKQERAAEDARAERNRRMHQELQDGGLQGLLYEPIVQRWIAGSAEQAPQTAAQAVAAAQAAKAAKEGVAARRTALVAALAAEGLGAYAPQQNMYYGYGYGRSQVPGLDAYVDGGEGSQAAVLEAARGLRAAEQARQQRREAATEALAGEGLGHHAYSSLEGWHSWVEGGIGSVEALVAAAREMQQVAEARAARRAHIEELLAAEGLQGQAWLPDVQVYVLHGTDGSEEAALEAARTAAAKEAASAERRAALEAALAVEGIPYNLVHHLDHVLGFVHDDLGTLESAMEAARSRHEAVQAREARTASLTAAFQAAGLQLAGWRYRLPGLEAFLAAGQGNAEALVAQAQAAAGGHAPAQHGYVV